MAIFIAKEQNSDVRKVHPASTTNEEHCIVAEDMKTTGEGRGRTPMSALK